MKIVIIFLTILISGTVILNAQETDCADGKLYNLVFKEMNLYEKKTAKIKIGYEPTKFVVDAINDMNLLSKKEMEQFNNLPQDLDYFSCAKFKRQMELTLDTDLIKANGSFNGIEFSKLISLSKTKKCLLRRTVSKSTKYEGGKVTGGEVLYVFNSKNNKWILTHKKTILTY
ncbi:hypothetical protein [Aquimarina aggregata]|uniref:hypothetical protein n=1 Tax=Aquimarina aggregata TaxID=1642818 RepID=UPI0024918BA0|nr:hypothetical protein [Aquimarina aggregata]